MKDHGKFLNNDHILARINNHQGFTLVEVLIALLVLGILFVPVSNAFLQSVKLNQHLQQRVTAVRDAQAAMEVTLAIMEELEVSDQHEQDLNNEEEIAEDIEERSNDGLKVNVEEPVEEELTEETPLQFAEKMTHQLSEFNSTSIVQPDTMVEIAPLHEDSPFVVITATSVYDTNEFNGSVHLTTLRLPGEAPWLSPKEYRVVTP